MLYSIVVLCISIFCYAMEENPPEIPALAASETADLQNELETIIARGTLEECKQQVHKAQQLSLPELQFLTNMYIPTRLEAIKCLVKTRYAIGYHMRQMEEAIKQLELQEKEKENKEFFGKIPVFDRYVKEEEAKLQEIKKILQTYENQWETEWFEENNTVGYIYRRKDRK